MNDGEDLPLTPEEQAALRRFEEAIQQFLEVFELPTGVLADWALITATHQANIDGDVATSCWTSDLQPRYRTLGLLAMADQTIRSTVF